MSWLSSALHGVGNVAGEVGHIAAKAAPFALAAAPFGGILSKIPGVGGALGALEGAASHIPGVGAVEQFLGSHGGVSGVVGKYGAPALMAAQGLNAANLGKQSTGYAKGALDSVNHSYDERAPLRARGIASMLHPQTPNLGGLQQVAGNNPYAPKPASAMLGGA